MSATVETILRCPAIRKRDGQPCAGKQTSSGWCVAHDPRSNEWRARGGAATSSANRAARLMPARLLPLVEQLEQVFKELGEGIWDERVRVVHAMVAVALAIGRLIQAGELEERTRELERMARECGLERERGKRGQSNGRY